MLIKVQDDVEDEIHSLERQFGPAQERAIISLAFDHPEFFSTVGQHFDIEYFREPEVQFIFHFIDDQFSKHNIIPTRDMCKDWALRELTADEDFQPIIDIIDRKSDPREVPIIRETIVEWARNKAYSMLYSDDAIDAYERQDYEVISSIFDAAQRITDVSSKGYWFFQNIDRLFEEDNETKLTCGFPRLDSAINEGGPTYGDVFCWIAPTGVGKSIMLVNSGVACLNAGLRVLYVTLELSEKKTSLRFMGALTEHSIRKRMEPNNKHKIKKMLERFFETHGDNFVIYEFPSDDITTDTIQGIIDNLRKQHSWDPDVVIIDYLELMLSRVPAYNNIADDYSRQKRVAHELCRLAKKENVLVFTANQTNRSGLDSKDESVIGLNKIAESYGKTMPMDYIISINQSQKEYDEGREDSNNPDSPNTNAICRFHIAKNRNGPKFITINARINYETMKAKQEQFI